MYICMYVCMYIYIYTHINSINSTYPLLDVYITIWNITMFNGYIHCLSAFSIVVLVIPRGELDVHVALHTPLI